MLLHTTLQLAVSQLLREEDTKGHTYICTYGYRPGCPMMTTYLVINIKNTNQSCLQKALELQISKEKTDFVCQETHECSDIEGRHGSFEVK